MLLFFFYGRQLTISTGDVESVQKIRVAAELLCRAGDPRADIVGAGVIENRNVLAVKALRFQNKRVNTELCDTAIVLLAGIKHRTGIHTGKVRMVCAYRRWETCVRVIQGLLGNILTPACLLAAAVDQMVADDRDGIGLERCAAMVACRCMAERNAPLLKVMSST